MKNRSLRYNFNVLGFALIAFLCVRQGLTIFFKVIGADKTLNIWLLCSILALVVSSFIPILIIENLSGTHPLIFKKVNIIPSLTLVGYSYLMITGVSVVNTVFLNLLRRVGVEFADVTLQPIDNPWTLILYFVLLCIAPAVVEEIFLRGYVLNMLRPFGRTFAIIASAVCFTFMHLQVQNLMPIFFCGILLACIYCLTDSIWVCILLHFVNNSVSFFMMYAQANIGGISALSFGIYLNLFVVIFGLMSRAYLHKINFRLSSMFKGDDKLDEKISLLFKSPVAVVAIICFIVITAEQLYRGIFVKI